MAIKLLELREITNWEVPIYVKLGGTRPYYDTALAVRKCWLGESNFWVKAGRGGWAAREAVAAELGWAWLW